MKENLRYFYKHSFNQKSKHKEAITKNISTDTLGSGSGYLGIRRAHYGNR